MNIANAKSGQHIAATAPWLDPRAQRDAQGEWTLPPRPSGAQRKDLWTTCGDADPLLVRRHVGHGDGHDRHSKNVNGFLKNIWGKEHPSCERPIHWKPKKEGVRW